MAHHHQQVFYTKIEGLETLNFMIPDKNRLWGYGGKNDCG